MTAPPHEVIFSTKIEDDLKRRDLLLMLLQSIFQRFYKDTIDMYGGLKDIHDKTIRTVATLGPIQWRSLRMIRAIRLAVELGFTCNSDTFKAIQSHSIHIKEVSLERIRDEITKIIMSKELREASSYFTNLITAIYYPRIRGRYWCKTATGPHVWCLGTLA